MKKTTSPYITVKKSKIHATGVFAKKDIPKGTYILEYVGDKITKKEGTKRELKQAKAKKGGTVYIFELNKKWDIDGKVPWNTARLINHSCDPNCEAEIDGKHIWIKSIRNIKKGEELTYDYGFDLEFWHDHPCKCGTKNCIGYMVGKEHWKKLRKLLEKK